MDYDGIIENLKQIVLVGESLDSSERLSRICSAIYHPDYGWTEGGCVTLCTNLYAMASDAKAYADMEANVERLHEAAENHEDITVNGVEYMPYPADCDGVPIHIGDEVSWSGFPDEYGEVKFLHVDADGDWSAGVSMSQYYAVDLHHRQRRNVEDVLTELLDMVTGGDGGGYGDIVESYAKLLCLAEVDND